jgi:hypothetical protein
MAGKIFVNYRRDDDPSAAARVRDALAARFGKANVFMDVDNLVAGQRFDEELAKALAQCDVLIAVVGARWTELLKSRGAGGEHDYVRQEIAGALRRGLLVIPVRVGREGSMPPLPRVDELPREIRDVVFHQKHDVAHERFGRDIDDLVAAILLGRKAFKTKRPWSTPTSRWSLVAGVVLATGLGGGLVAQYLGAPLPWLDRTARKSDSVADLTKAEKERTGHYRSDPADKRGPHTFDGTWEVNGINGGSCPKPNLEWKALPIRITSSQISVNDTVVGRVLENGNFEYTRPLAERPSLHRTFRGTLRADSGQGTYRYSEGPCRGALVLKRL